jgi:superfamily II DNA/RNA helicase
MTFADLGLSDELLRAVAESGYDEPTPIQRAAIPSVLMGKDLIGIAQTGTGKTASFVLPMLDILDQGRSRARMPRSLILEPTRELAQQVSENFDKYGKYHRLSMALLIGGVQMGDQIKALEKGVDVLIATPGRLMDLFQRGKIMLNGCDLLVIDEADRMLDMGFIPDIERIGKLVPFTRQTLFFTATMPAEIQRIADTFLHNPVRVEVARPATTASTITQSLVACGSEPHEKRATLRQLLRGAADMKNAIIFCNRKRDVALLHRSLTKHGFNAVALHGDMEQPARMAALDAFRKGDATILVASDVAARGLDIPAVSHVFNFDVPYHPDDYVHRIGRTGRAGRLGSALTLVGSSVDKKAVAAIEKLTGQTIGWLDTPPAEFDEAPRRERQGRQDRQERQGRGGRSGRRHGRGGNRPDEAESAPKGNVARLDEARDRKRNKPQAAPAAAPADGIENHLPAFLLRPVRIKA